MNNFLQMAARSVRNSFGGGGTDNSGNDSETTVEYPMPNDEPTLPFAEGDIVKVEPRTTPGINKPGGVGKVMSIDADHNTATVQYVIGQKRTDTNVPAAIISKYDYTSPRASRREM